MGQGTFLLINILVFVPSFLQDISSSILFSRSPILILFFPKQKYYADESSRAAHHFYQNPNATSAPFPLPPAPPSSSETVPAEVNKFTSSSDSSKNNSYGSHQQEQQQKDKSHHGNNGSGTGLLTRYVKRNLELCKSEQEKKFVQGELEKKIAKALQNGTLQSHDWDNEPLLVNHVNDNSDNVPLQNNNAIPKSQISLPAYQEDRNYYGNYGMNSANTQNHHYGPAEVTPSNINHSGGGGGGRRGGNTGVYSYYGPSGASSAPSSLPSSLSPTTGSSSSSSHVHSLCGKNNKQKRGRRGSADAELDHGSQQQEDYVPLPSAASSSLPHRKSKKQKLSSSLYGLDASQQALAKRASRFSGPGGIEDASSSSTISGTSDKYMGKRLIGGKNIVLDEADYEQMTVKGTSTTLEKEYLRLTAPPKAELVRPLPILKQHLSNLKSEYYLVDRTGDAEKDVSSILADRERKSQDLWNIKVERKHDYLWFCSQLKAVRQDCTVQRIQGRFAIDVYETHARIALQEGDLNE
jgi:hypothetical protein